MIHVSLILYLVSESVKNEYNPEFITKPFLGNYVSSISSRHFKILSFRLKWTSDKSFYDSVVITSFLVGNPT